jgi:nucleolin
MNAKLFVASLSWSVTEDELYNLFSEVGAVVSVRIPTRREDGKPRGFAFVEMSSPAEGQQAVNRFNNSMLHDRVMVVSFQDESRGSNPRGAGGSSYGSSAAPNAKLFVRNVHRSVREDELTEVFQRFGNVISAKIPTDRDTGEPKGFAFVEMQSAEEAKAVIDNLSGFMLQGKDLAIDFQDPNRAKSKPPRSNGGYGNGGGNYGRNDSSYSRW